MRGFMVKPLLLLDQRSWLAMVEVQLGEGDRIEAALRVFKKKVQRAGVLQDLRRRRHYVKPSEARQLKTAAAQRRLRSKKGGSSE
jgi:small subunit ribosomal protein S21